MKLLVAISLFTAAAVAHGPPEKEENTCAEFQKRCTPHFHEKIPKDLKVAEYLKMGEGRHPPEPPKFTCKESEIEKLKEGRKKLYKLWEQQEKQRVNCTIGQGDLTKQCKIYPLPEKTPRHCLKGPHPFPVYRPNCCTQLYCGCPEIQLCSLCNSISDLGKQAAELMFEMEKLWLSCAPIPPPPSPENTCDRLVECLTGRPHPETQAYQEIIEANAATIGRCNATETERLLKISMEFLPIDHELKVKMASCIKGESEDPFGNGLCGKLKLPKDVNRHCPRMPFPPPPPPPPPSSDKPVPVPIPVWVCPENFCQDLRCGCPESTICHDCLKQSELQDRLAAKKKEIHMMFIHCGIPLPGNPRPMPPPPAPLPRPTKVVQAPNTCKDYLACIDQIPHPNEDHAAILKAARVHADKKLIGSCDEKESDAVRELSNKVRALWDVEGKAYYACLHGNQTAMGSQCKFTVEKKDRACPEPLPEPYDKKHPHYSYCQEYMCGCPEVWMCGYCYTFSKTTKPLMEMFLELQKGLLGCGVPIVYQVRF